MKDQLTIKEFITGMSKKHKVKPESIMVGFVYNDMEDLYVWDWNAGRKMDDQFRVLEIIDINTITK